MEAGPREAILAFIENYTAVVVPVNAALLEGLRLMEPRMKEK
jgi:hypothetical protein